MGVQFPTGVDVAGSRITRVGDAVDPTDAPSLAQVQAFAQGRAYKDPVRAASTTNVNVASPGASIDGVGLSAGDAVLLKNQTTASQNGIYVWAGATSPLTRRADANTGAKLLGARVGVLEGATQADTGWVGTADSPITVGTTALPFVRDVGGGPTYSAGNGIDITGTTVSVKPKSGGGVAVTADGVAIDTAVVCRKVAGTLGDGTATSFTLTHQLGTVDVQLVVRLAATGERVIPDDVASSSNAVTVTFGTAPAAGAYRWSVFG